MKTFKELRVELEEWNSGTGELGVIQYHDDGSYDVKISSGGRGGLFGGGYPRPKPNSKTGYKAVNKDDIPGAKVVDDTKTGYKAAKVSNDIPGAKVVDDTKTGYKAAKVSNDIPGAKAVSDHDSLKAYAASKLKKMSEEYFVEDLDSDDLYSVLVEEEYGICDRALVAMELFERGDIELYEDEYEDLMNLLEIALELPAPSSTAVANRSSTSVGGAKAPMKDMGWAKRVDAPKLGGSAKSVATKSGGATLKDVGKSALGALGRIAKRYAPHVGALVGGYELGKQLNKIPSVSSVTDKIGKKIADKISGVPEVNKAKPRSVDNTAGMKLTGKPIDPVSTALRGAEPEPQVNKRLIGPMGGAKADTSGNAARTAPTRKALPSSGVKRLSTAVGKPSKNIPVVDTAVKPISKGSKSSAPVPVIKKVSPKELTKPKIAAKVDKSIDVAQQTGVTARMGQSGRTQTFSNIARGASSDKSSSGMFQKAGTEYSAQKNLPSQGSAARDVELAKRGFKKF